MRARQEGRPKGGVGRSRERSVSDVGRCRRGVRSRGGGRDARDISRSTERSPTFDPSAAIWLPCRSPTAFAVQTPSSRKRRGVEGGRIGPQGPACATPSALRTSDLDRRVSPTNGSERPTTPPHTASSLPVSPPRPSRRRRTLPRQHDRPIPRPSRTRPETVPSASAVGHPCSPRPVPPALLDT